jgi:hypothetical protein
VPVNSWVALAVNIRQRDQIVVGGTWLASETITLRIANLDLVITVGTTVTTAAVAAQIVAAINGTLSDATYSMVPTGGAPAIPVFKELSATLSGSTATILGGGIGDSDKPFTMTSSTTSAAGTLTHTTPIVATGSHHANAADNWSLNAAPANDDDIVFNSGDVSCKYNTAMGIQPASFTRTAGYKGEIGLPEINLDATGAPYAEYRTKSMTFIDNSVTTTATIDASGSGLTRIAAGAGQWTLNVTAAASRKLTSVPVVLLTGTDSANEINVSGSGDLGVAFYAGEAATLAIARQIGTESKLVLGSGVTLTGAAINLGDGRMDINSANTGGTIVVNGGDLWRWSGAHPSVTINKGTVHDGSTGTLGATLLSIGQGKLEKLDARATAIGSTVQLHKGASLIDKLAGYTGLACKLNGCTIADVTIDAGYNRTVTVS